jgi:hypothetical protein
MDYNEGLKNVSGSTAQHNWSDYSTAIGKLLTPPSLKCTVEEAKWVIRSFHRIGGQEKSTLFYIHSPSSRRPVDVRTWSPYHHHQVPRCTYSSVHIYIRLFCFELLAYLLIGIDYRCDDGRFIWVSASWLSSLNPALLSSSETRVNLGIKSWKKCLSESAQCQQAISDIYFTETEDLRPYIAL